MDSLEITSPLADALVKSGRLSRENLERALAEQRSGTLSLGIVLVRMGFVSEGVRLGVLTQKLGYAQYDPANEKIEPEAAALIPRAIIESQRLFPLRRDGKTLVVAMEDPSDELLLGAIRHHTKMEVKGVAAVTKDLELLVKEGAEGAIRRAAQLRDELRRHKPLNRILRAMFFPVVLFAPLVLFFLAALIDPFQQILLNGDNSMVDIGIYVGLGWGLWAIIFYEINVAFIQKADKGN